jgi:hypothetical protein
MKAVYVLPISPTCTKAYEMFAVDTDLPYGDRFCMRFPGFFLRAKEAFDLLDSGRTNPYNWEDVPMPGLVTLAMTSDLQWHTGTYREAGLE